MDFKELCGFVVVILMMNGIDAMSRAQMKNTAKMLRTSCLKKIQVAEDMIDTIEKGNFIEDKKVMCYIACIFEKTSVPWLAILKTVEKMLDLKQELKRIMQIKNNKINYESSMKQIDMMYPPELKESAKAAATKCKDVQKKYKDICEASYWTAKCLYEFKPEDFVFA